MLLKSWCLISEKADIPYFDKCGEPWNFEEQRRWNIVNTLLRWLRHRGVVFSHRFPSISSVFTEQCRIGVKSLLSEFRIILWPVQRDLRQRLSRNQWCHLRQCLSTNSLLADSSEQGNLLQQYRRTFWKLPDDIQVIKTCTDAGFMKTVSEGQYFVTIHDVEMAKLGCPGLCRKYTWPRDCDLSRQAKRMDSREHKNWSSIGSHSDLSPTPLRNWN